MDEEGYSPIFYIMLGLGIFGLLGFSWSPLAPQGDVMPLYCVLLIVFAFLVGVGGTVVLWAASAISGRSAEAETPEPEE